MSRPVDTPTSSSAATLCHKPHLQRLLAALRLDVEYVRSAGSHLYFRDGASDACETKVVDLVGGFGSLLLGHHHPVLVAEAQRLLSSGLPVHAQGSSLRLAERLAQELAQRVRGDYCCVFANSGAEAVEIALKHALLETNGRTLIAVEGAFHGKTLGALQAIGNADFREPFELTGLHVFRVPANDEAALEAAFAGATDLIGFLFEPILGEGGVRPLTAAFVQRAAALCTDRNVPLIADECQTGCGRTGRFLACEDLGVQPDYILLSKSLGGGLAKIGAALIRRSRYKSSFDLKHTSTFAADNFSCSIALKVLELLDAPLLTRVNALGEQFQRELCRLQAAYPGVIAEVRGRGLMIGLEFKPQHLAPSFLLRLLSSQRDLLFLISGYLLHRHGVRMLPTLSDPWTFRLQPPVCLSERDLEQCLHGLKDVCQRLQENDLPGLAEFLLAGEPAVDDESFEPRTRQGFFAFNEPRFQKQQQQIPPRRVAWLCHMIDADDLTKQEPRLGEFPFDDREALLERCRPFACPVVMSGVDVVSAQGEVVRLYPIMLPFSSRMAKQALDARQLTWFRGLIRSAIDVARSLGCSLVSLGQYTSILTNNGRSLADVSGLGITSGNSYTVALALEAIERIVSEHGADPAELTLAVVGAGGNIGRTCAGILSGRFARTVLIGSEQPQSRLRLERLASRWPRTTVAAAYGELSQAHVVISAINSVDAPLGPDDLGPAAIVCDISLPPSVQRETAAERPDVTILKGGLARLPHGEDLQIASYPLPVGQCFGCLGEALLLGLAGVSDHSFTGSVTTAKVQQVKLLAQRFGLELVDYKRACVLGTDRSPARISEGLHVPG